MNASFWLELFLRSAVLMLAGELILRALRRTHPAVRHWFVLCFFTLLALLPVFAVLLPDIPLSLWTQKAVLRGSVSIVELSSAPLAAAPRRPLNWLLLTWSAGVLASLTPLALGLFSIRRIARRARPLSDGLFASNDVRTPVTCGIFRPRILLPSEAETWSPARLQAVLLHERAHIHRHDVAIQIGAHVIASLWWFQPLVWLMRRRLRAESEFACDADAVRSGIRASEYASELLALANNAGRRAAIPGAAIAMVRSNHLEDRIRAVLGQPVSSFRPAKISALGLLLAVAAVAASAVTFPSQNNAQDARGSTMKRTILSTLLTSTALSAATVSGTVHDSTGAALSDAKVTIHNPDTAADQEATTDSSGRFSFTGSGPGQYILRIERPGFVSIFREFDVRSESNMERVFTMTPEGGQSVADNIVSDSQDESKKIRVGGQVAQNNLAHKVQPIYPPAAKASRLQGTVEIEAVISKDGVPVELRVVSSPGDDLSASSLEAVRQWRYRPTLLNGAPVEIVTTIVVNYTLAQ